LLRLTTSRQMLNLYEFNLDLFRFYLFFADPNFQQLLEQTEYVSAYETMRVQGVFYRMRLTP
jgi:hypothetical protein